MRRFGCSVRRVVVNDLQRCVHPRETSCTPGFQFDQHSYNTVQRHRYIAAQGSARTYSIERTIRDVSDAHPANAAKILEEKKPQRSRISSLYGVLVYENPQNEQPEKWRNAMAVKKDGAMVDEALDASFKTKLENCREVGHAEEAIAVLGDMERRCLTPATRAIVMVVEACIAADEFQLAENVLEQQHIINDDHPALRPQLISSAWVLLAMTHSSRGQFEDALRVMKFKDYRNLDAKNMKTFSRAICDERLGNDPLAWGVVVKALTKLGYPAAAVNVMNIAMSRDVGMTDALLHLTIDALRVQGKWKQADWLFNAALRKGVQPRERTIASILYALSSQSARKIVGSDRIEELVDMAPNPSPRFMLTALTALASTGALQRSIEFFERIGECEQSGVPPEQAFLTLMGCFANYIILRAHENETSSNTESVLEDINMRADDLWEDYLKEYRRQQPDILSNQTRNSLLARYVWTKTRCLKLKEAIDVIENIAEDSDNWPWFELKNFHMAAVLGTIELASNVSQMNRILNIMDRLLIEHDPRSLAFCIGTYIGDGNLAEALQIARKEGQRVLRKQALDSVVRPYHPVMLQRRLEMLVSALQEGGHGTPKDISDMVQTLKDHSSSSV